MNVSSNGGWPDSVLSKSGSLIRNKIKFFNNPTGVDFEPQGLNLNFELQQNFPNPFNPKTTIEYDKGEKISSGVYFYNLIFEDKLQIKKFVQLN